MVFQRSGTSRGREPQESNSWGPVKRNPQVEAAEETVVWSSTACKSLPRGSQAGEGAAGLVASTGPSLASKSQQHRPKEDSQGRSGSNFSPHQIFCASNIRYRDYG